MVNGLHLYSAFIQSALQFLPLIHPFTHTFTHQRRLAAMQGTNQLVRSNWGLGVLLRDTSTRPGWDRTGNPPTARRQLYLLSHIDYISSTDPAVDYRYSSYFLFDDPILDEAVIQANKIFEDHRILSSVKIDLCQMFSAMSISED